MSDDGATTLVVIGLVGNPFSPAYASARDTGKGPDPLRFSALNVAIRSRGNERWSLTERAIAEGDRTGSSVAFGASHVRWDGDELVIDVVERTTDIVRLAPRTVRGTVRFRPEGLTGRRYTLDPEGDHAWWPVAPLGKVEARFSEPELVFRGTGYHDANAGRVPIERSFGGWSWCRGEVDGEAIVGYETTTRDGARVRHAFVWDGQTLEDVALDGDRALERSRWGIARRCPADLGALPRSARWLEDTPFYARSLVDTRLLGRPIRVVHESLDGDRLARRWVRSLLGFKMGRP